ncbi:MAG TPA: Spy/CpxP family protein refolding chaperone [Pyrinomonadaceae bacterium]|jgi:protein CpxP
MKITNFKNIFGGAALGLAILAGGATTINAQETQTQPQTEQKTDKQWKHRRGDGLRRGGKHGRGGEMRMFGGLNLSDAQKEQLKQIADRYRENHKAARQQMRTDGTAPDPAQREQMRAKRKETHEQMRAEMLNVLTAEQKTQLQQFEAERKQRFEQRRQQFEQRRKQREAQPAPTVN